MIQPARLPLVGNRYTPFVYSIAFRGLSLAGAAIEAMVRLYPDAPGEWIAKFNVTSNVVSDSGFPISTVTLTLSEAEMTAMPRAGEIGDPTELAWDMVIQERDPSQTDPNEPPSGAKYVPLNGPFIVNPGVTHG